MVMGLKYIIITLALLCTVGLSKAEEISFLHIDTKEVDSSEFGGPEGSTPTTCPCGWTNKGLSRIVGGKETLEHEYPWVAVVKDKHTPFKFCGATIITPRHALTGAHCTWRRRVEGDPIVVVIGEHDVNKENDQRQVIDVARIIEHEKFHRVSLVNDIALLVLATKIEFNKYIGPACLPTTLPNLDHKYVKILGWGDTSNGGESSDVLLSVNARVVPTQPCSYSYPGKIASNDASHLCTYRRRRGSCQGDSGGPVTWLDPATNRYTLVGIVSFGAKCASTSPTVNTRVSHFIPWIQDKIAATNPEGMSCHKA